MPEKPIANGTIIAADVDLTLLSFYFAEVSS